MNKPKKFLFTAHKILAENFVMSDDGRKAKHKSACRRSLFMELASFADADGRGAWPSAKTLAKRLGQSERSVQRYLADLTKLGFCESRGKSKFGGSAIRDLILPITTDSTVSITTDSTSITTDSSPIPPANGGQPAFDLPTNAPAHLPANTVAGDVESAVKWVRETFEGKTGKILPKQDSQALFSNRLPEAVKGTVEQWLEQRDLTGLKNPAYFLVREFEDYYDPANRPERDYTKEEIDAIAARIHAEPNPYEAALAEKKEAEAYAMANVDKWL